jgi:hypothetical protein
MSDEAEKAREKAAARATRKEVFLCALFDGATTLEAARIAGIGRRTAYNWRAEDAHFDALWRAQEEAGDDPVEVEAIRRALMGVKKPVYRGGTLVGEVTEKSDSLLMFLLKSRQPAKYGGKAEEGAVEDVKLKRARVALLSKLCSLPRSRHSG